MNAEDAKKLLEGAGQTVTRSERMSDGRGTRLDLESGAIVNVYDTGSVNVQGKADPALKKLFSKDAPKSVSRKVFVVYGHDEHARTKLEAMLRRWELEPLILDQLPSEGQTIIEKLEKYWKEAGFAVVLSTPDDEGHRATHPDEKQFRVRQNVVLELGMVLAHLGRSKVAILMKDPGKMERPSDIQGLIYISFKECVSECTTALIKEMAAQGLKVDPGKL